MSYGFSLHNSSGYVQIDQDYSNYIVIANGTILATPNGTGGVFPYATYDALYGSRNAYEVFFRPHSYGIPIGQSQISDVGDNDMIWALSNVLVDWLILIPAYNISPPTSNYGMVIYRPDGSLCFSSDTSYTRILANVYVPYLYVGAGLTERDYTIPAGRFNNWFQLVRTNCNSPHIAYRAVSLLNETTLRVSLYRYNPAATSIWYPHYRLIANH